MTIEILTAARNAVRTLPDCLASVAAQRLPAAVEIHHRVLDGASTDASLAVLEVWSAERSGRSFSSEEDGGFYHAINRGIQDSDADVVGILNADDFLADPQVLERVATAFSAGGFDGVYGDLIYVTPESGFGRSDNRIVRRWQAGPYAPASFRWGWMPPHPTIYVRRNVYDQVGCYRTDFGSAADYEWIVRTMVRHAAPFAYISFVQVLMRAGGMSNRSLRARLAANSNDRRAWTVNGLRPYPWTTWMKPLRKVGQWLRR